MSRPLPVIHFATKITDSNRRCKHQPHVFQERVLEQNISLAGEHLGHFCSQAGMFFLCGKFQFFATLVDSLGAFQE